MDISKALEMKQAISDSLLSGNRRSRSIGLGARSAAGAVEMAGEMANLVNGVGIGQKANGENFIKIFSRNTLSVSEAYISDYYGVPKKDISVEQVGQIEFMNATLKYRPPFPGISAGHYKITAGTLGCFVEDNKGGIYILSNNHVLADTDKGLFGDPVLQPGVLDGGKKKTDMIATLSHVVPLDRKKPNAMDAAIAKVESDIPVEYAISKTNKITGTTPPVFNQKVEKFGRTTGHTTGNVTVTNIDMQVDFNKQIISFTDQFQVKAARGKKFCEGGDSGSLIFEQGTLNAVGLLFAGTRDGTTFATPIDEVLSAFSVKIL